MDEQTRTLRYRLPRGDGLVVERLLRRDGFVVAGPDGGVGSPRAELSVVAETDGRAARVREVIARWAPGASVVS